MFVLKLICPNPLVVGFGLAMIISESLLLWCMSPYQHFVTTEVWSGMTPTLAPYDENRAWPSFSTPPWVTEANGQFMSSPGYRREGVRDGFSLFGWTATGGSLGVSRSATETDFVLWMLVFLRCGHAQGCGASSRASYMTSNVVADMRDGSNGSRAIPHQSTHGGTRGNGHGGFHDSRTTSPNPSFCDLTSFNITHDSSVQIQVA